VVDTAQVVGHLAGAGDADEHRRLALAADFETNLAVAVATDDRVEAVEVEVDVVAGERPAAGGEALGVAADVTVLVLLAVGPEQDTAGGEQAEREERERAGGDECGDPGSAVG
jgi:hypothetical protein